MSDNAEPSSMVRLGSEEAFVGVSQTDIGLTLMVGWEQLREMREMVGKAGYDSCSTVRKGN